MTPSVSIIIAAYNEEQNIGQKIANIQSLDYPVESIEILVASDGSTDATNQIVRETEDPRVRLLELPRRGKAAALNDAVKACTGEILVFSDANSLFSPNSLRPLLRPFADPSIGGVAGDQRYTQESAASSTDSGERSYWGFDRFLKLHESAAGNVISATGAIYAIRRRLFWSVPEGVTDDFATSTAVIAQGWRLVFVPSACVYEPVAKQAADEFGRKVRVTTRGLRSLLARRELLNPLRYGFYSCQLISHKWLRRLMVFPLIVLFVTSLLLWNQGLVYRAAAGAQLTLYWLAAFGGVVGRWPVGRGKLFSLPAYFVMVNAACLVAVLKIVGGQRVVLWDPRREQTHRSHNADDRSGGANAPAI